MKEQYVAYKNRLALIMCISMLFLTGSCTYTGPRHAEAYKYLDKAIMYEKQKEYDLAIEAYENSLKKGLASPITFNNLGSIYFFEKKDFENAKNIWQKGVSLFPKDDSLHLNLSQLFFEEGKLQEGLGEYKLFVKYTKHPETTIYVDKINEILKNQSKTTEEIADFYENVIEINPKDYLARYEFAERLVSTGKYKRALEQYKKILEIRPNFDLVYFSLGSCYYNLGQPALALEYFKKAKEAGHFVPEIFFEKLEKELSENK